MLKTSTDSIARDVYEAFRNYLAVVTALAFCLSVVMAVADLLNL